MRITVLVVDDHEDIRVLIRTLLSEDPGIEVLGEADSADAALAKVESLDPDVVLLDARMPRVDGFQAAARILARRPGQAIVLLTAVVDDQIRRRAYEAGMRGCLCKDQLELAEALKAVMRRGGPGAPGTPARP